MPPWETWPEVFDPRDELGSATPLLRCPGLDEVRARSPDASTLPSSPGPTSQTFSPRASLQPAYPLRSSWSARKLLQVQGASGAWNCALRSSTRRLLFGKCAGRAAWLAWRAGIPDAPGLWARQPPFSSARKPCRYPSQAKLQRTNSSTISNCFGAPDELDHPIGKYFIVLSVGSQAKQHAEERLLAAGAHSNALRVAIGAGASYGSAKCWPPDRWAEVAEWLNRRLQCRHTSCSAHPPKLPCLSPSLPACAARPFSHRENVRCRSPGASLSSATLFIGND